MEGAIGVNDKKLCRTHEIQQKKLYNLRKEQSPPYNDPEKVIFNLSTTLVLTAPQKQLLAKGLNFAILPKKLNYADY